jgi:hypothetical protein
MIDTHDPVFTFEEIAYLVEHGSISLEFGASLAALFYTHQGWIVSTQPCALDSGKLVPVDDNEAVVTSIGWSSTIPLKEVIRLKTLLR